MWFNISRKFANFAIPTYWLYVNCKKTSYTLAVAKNIKNADIASAAASTEITFAKTNIYISYYLILTLYNIYIVCRWRFKIATGGQPESGMF